MQSSIRNYYLSHLCLGHAAGRAVGLETALQATKSRVRFPMVSLEPIPAVLLWGKGGRCVVRRVDNLSTFMSRLSRNLRASTSWKPLSFCNKPVEE
jgi:hypothetical protein